MLTVGRGVESNWNLGGQTENRKICDFLYLWSFKNLINWVDKYPSYPSSSYAPDYMYVIDTYFGKGVEIFSIFMYTRHQYFWGWEKYEICDWQFGILLPKLFWPTVRKNCSCDREKKKIEITRTICSNSERSEQFLVTECFFNLFLEVSQV